VSVNAASVDNGRLQVTIGSSTVPAAPTNRLLNLQIMNPPNAVVNIRNGPQGLTGTQRTPVEAGTQPIIFFVRRTGPLAITVLLVAVDTCGPWRSFMGRGDSVF